MSQAKTRQNLIAALIAIFIAAPALALSAVEPLNGCTYYKPRLLPGFRGCAEFSAVRGRQGCHKVKGVCPNCVRYLGDDVQMWLPDYFIEVTRHVGRSIFAESLDSGALAAQLALGVKWWELSTHAPVLPGASNGMQSPHAASSFWHARILTVPYGAEVSNFPPLSSSKGSGLPICFSALSEFLPAQWNFNVADAPYAIAWAQVGAPLCLSIVGGAVAAGAGEAKRRVRKIAGGVGSMPTGPVDSSCANPVGAAEAMVKDAQPSADTLAPLSGDLTALCMGTWGNLVPRTGWIGSDDPYMSALAAAYKFQSLAGDMHLNASLKLLADDKWQIVYPPRPGSACFRPGSPLADIVGMGGDDPVARASDEITPAGSLKGHTYVLAVWRRRNSCEEPLEAVGGWTAVYQANFVKNQGLCQAVPSL